MQKQMQTVDIYFTCHDLFQRTTARFYGMKHLSYDQAGQ